MAHGPAIMTCEHSLDDTDDQKTLVETCKADVKSSLQGVMAELDKINTTNTGTQATSKQGILGEHARSYLQSSMDMLVETMDNPQLIQDQTYVLSSYRHERFSRKR